MQIPVITATQFAQLALSFPGTEQVPHFDRIGFDLNVVPKHILAEALLSAWRRHFQV